MKTNLGNVISLVLAISLAVPCGNAQAGQSSAPAPSVKPHRHSPYIPNHPPQKADEYYTLVWGVDSLSVRAVESGSLVRFSYHVVDPVKAALFNDKTIEPFLDSPEHGIRLVVPALEKVGKLRQSNTPEAGRSYWMAFSNPRRTVKPGNHVNVVIGRFHANGLVVQ